MTTEKKRESARQDKSHKNAGTKFDRNPRSNFPFRARYLGQGALKSKLNSFDKFCGTMSKVGTFSLPFGARPGMESAARHGPCARPAPSEKKLQKKPWLPRYEYSQVAPTYQ